MKLNEILIKLENAFPKAFSRQEDNCGLQVGDPENTIRKILVALEATMEVIEFAVKNCIELIITHHPLIYDSLNHIRADFAPGRLIFKTIQNNIAIFSAHTNADSMTGGLTDHLAGLLNLAPLSPISVIDSAELVKLVTFLPVAHAQKLRERLLSEGTLGHIGRYSHCSFNVEGRGTFLPGEGTVPHIGEPGRFEETREVRFESILFKKDISRTVNLLKSVHPYEEVAYDFYPLCNAEGKPGIGRICSAPEGCRFGDIVKLLPQKLDIDFIRYNGDPQMPVSRVALCTGSGGSFIHTVSNVDLLITGDISYHQAMTALEKNIAFVDIGHDQEKIFIPFMEVRLKEMGLDVQIIPYKHTLNPFRIKTFREDLK